MTPYQCVSCVLVLLAFTVRAAADCGQPPSSTSVSHYFMESIRTLACSASSVGGSLDAVIDDIPFGANFTSDQKSCTNQTQSVQEASNNISQYIYTPDSIVIAECGYRACLLVDNGASEAALEAFYAICSARGAPQTYPDFILENGSIQITTPVTGDTGEKDSKLIINNNTGEQFKVSDIGSFAQGVKIAPQIPNQVLREHRLTLVPVKVTYPKQRPESSLPVDFKVNLENKADLDGTLYITKNIHCAKPCKHCDVVNDKPICRACEVSVADLVPNNSYYSLAVPNGTVLNTVCRNMEAGSAYTLNASGDVWPDFLTINGGRCGTNLPNDQIDWQVFVDATAASGATNQTSQYQALGILEFTRRVTIQGGGTVDASGEVDAYIHAPDVGCWPNTHGPLALSTNFVLSIDAPDPSVSYQHPAPKVGEHKSLSCSPPKGSDSCVGSEKTKAPPNKK